MKTRISIIIIFSLIFITVSCQAPDKSQKIKTAMNTNLLTNSTVKKAIDALQAADANTWFSQFTDDAELFDDGNKKDFRKFFGNALGHERFTSIDKVENNGLAIYGQFHSDHWGDFKTYFRFRIDAGDRINRLEIGQADY